MNKAVKYGETCKVTVHRSWLMERPPHDNSHPTYLSLRPGKRDMRLSSVLISIYNCDSLPSQSQKVQQSQGAVLKPASRE